MRRFSVAAADLAVLAFAYAGAFAVRMNFVEPLCGWRQASVSAVSALTVQMAALTLLGLNRPWRWRVTGSSIPRYFSAFAISASLLLFMRSLMGSTALSWARPPYSVTLIDMVFAFFGVMAFRLLRERYLADSFGVGPSRKPAKRKYDGLSGKVVMVTGAGGSIGAEIVRQVLEAGAKRILMVERGENALYRIDLEVGSGVCVPLMIDVNDEEKLEAAFEAERPSIVFHAAAYKHVPMCELNPEEARRNNTEATEKVVRLAKKYGAEKLVFISTDKAVNPTSVMGRCKRDAEKIVLDGGFTCVRFGNVFGSSGSVIELWRGQIAKGGPVTVTDRRMKRYFMSVEEAVSLVLAAACLESGHVYVLDMGEPRWILEMAEMMIREAGYRPYEDIGIEFIGIRPGEKLEEELGIDGAEVVKTGYGKIYRI